MWEILSWLAILAAVAGLGVLAAMYGRGAFDDGVASAFFRPRAVPRIEVIEHAAVDGKRKLMLIRRDDVEHLIMTGGPVDVVIETGITPPLADTIGAGARAASVADLGARPPPMFGQVSDDAGGAPPRAPFFAGRRAPPVSAPMPAAPKAPADERAADATGPHLGELTAERG